MIRTQAATQREGDVLLSPKAIAATCAGRVLRTGRPAGRVVIDSREVRAGDCFVALPGDRFDGHDFVADVVSRGAAGVIVCQPIARASLNGNAFVVRVQDSYAALMALARRHRQEHDAKVIGITGSCGKTSTKDMLAAVLGRAMPTVHSPKSFNNQVGVPLTLFQIEPESRVAVVEIGTNAPGEIEQLAGIALPDIGIVTRVDASHLMHLHSVEGVAAEKSRLIAALPADGVAILNGDDPNSSWMHEVTGARVVSVRVGAAADWFATDVSFYGLSTSFRLNGEEPVTLPRLGTHNVYNALLTIAAATELGVDRDVVLAGLCEAGPSARRLECKRVGDIAIVDDTYNSNPASARAAMLTFAGLNQAARRIVVLGEMLELGEESESRHRQLGEEVARAGVDLLVTVGAGALPVAEAALQAGMAVAAAHAVADSTAALELLVDEVRGGDWLLCKASRGVGLDRLVDGLQERLGT